MNIWIATVVSYFKFLHERCLIEIAGLRNRPVILRNPHSRCRRWLYEQASEGGLQEFSISCGCYTAVHVAGDNALYHEIMETVRASIPESKGLLNKNLGLEFDFETALTGMYHTYIEDFVGFQSPF